MTKRELSKQPWPVTCCSFCGKAGRDDKLIGRPCGHALKNGKKCEGKIEAAIGDSQWIECPCCGATGADSAADYRIICWRCDGSGWISFPKRPGEELRRPPY